MEKKDQRGERKAPAPKRPPQQKAPPRRPKEQVQQTRAVPDQPGLPAQGVDEVFIPEAQTQQVRHSDEAQPAARRKAAPRQTRAKTPARPASSGKKEEQYRPYRQANQRRKTKKRQSARQSVSKFFSSQNPVVKLFYKEDPAVFGEDASAIRRKKRAAAAEKKRKRAERLNTPAVIYTQPMTFNSRRLAVQLITVLAVVLALVLGMSVFFKVEDITVIGANVYSASTIREKSGINIGDNLLTFGRTRACGQIIANLPYVKSARIGIKLPDTVNIEIEEEAVTYSIQAQDGVWWLINSDGKVVEQSSTTNAKNYTQVLGVTLYNPQPGEQGVATEQAPVPTDSSDPTDPSAPTAETMPVLITGMQRLNAALQILQALELNDIVGDAASVDVSQLQDIILWYGTQYQVNLGALNDAKNPIEYKIAYMKSAVMQMSDYQTGILDVSFTTWPDQIGYTPFT